MNLPRDLEDAIVAAPDDRELYRVAADWLEQAGAPHAELVALSLEAKTNATLDRIIELKRALLPPELRRHAVEWRWGFVRGVAIASLHDPDEARVLRELLVSPLGRFVQKVVVSQASARLAGAVLEAAELEPRALRCLRTLMVFADDAGAQPYDLARLSVATPALRRLVLRVARTRGALALPELDELVLDGNAEASSVIARASLPRLGRVQIDRAGIDRDAPNGWLVPERLPALRTVALTDDGALDTAAWLGSAIAPQLALLDIYIVERGAYPVRRLVIDRVPRAATAGLLVLVGRTYDPGTLFPIDRTPFVVGRIRTAQVRIQDNTAATVHAEIYAGWLVQRSGGDVHLNGHSIGEAYLRHDDELAIAEHVFRFLEGDIAALAAEQRVRYGL